MKVILLQRRMLCGRLVRFAQNIEDVLARRVRMLFLDARAALKIAPKVASVLAAELGKDKTWEQAQIADFNRLARGYILN